MKYFVLTARLIGMPSFMFKIIVWVHYANLNPDALNFLYIFLQKNIFFGFIRCVIWVRFRKKKG